MALTSTLGSPGIEIREIDNSIRIDTSTSTTVFVPGFASQGPVEEVISIGSMEDFELIYGKPTNGAERYFYYTVKALIDKGGSGCRVLTSRLPYGEGLGDAVSDAYTLLAYPAIPIIKTSNGSETDCFKFDNKLSGIFKIKTTNDEISADDELSSYDIFIEEDYLHETIKDTIDDKWYSYDSSNKFSEITETIEESAVEQITIDGYDVYNGSIDGISSIIFKDKTGDKWYQYDSSSNNFSEITLSSDAEQINIDGYDVYEYNGGDETIPSIIFKKNENSNIISWEDEKLKLSLTGDKLPAITDIETNSPDITLTLGYGNTYETEGHIATEFTNGHLYVNLAYTIYSGKGENTGDKTTKTRIGNAVFRLVFTATASNGLTSSNVNTYSIDGVTTDMSFKPAFEIAASYDGQSKEQLGDWTIETKGDKNSQKKDVRDTTKYSKDVTYLIGAPAAFQISLKEYYNIITGELINWSRRPYDFSSTATSESKVYENSLDEKGSQSKFGLIEALGHSAFITINTSRTCINENFEGYYLGITDNTFSTPSDDYIFDAISGVKITTDTYITKNKGKTLEGESKDILGIIDNFDPTLGDYSTLGEQRLTFKLRSNNQGSLSRVITRNMTSKDISSTDFDDTISMGLFKLSKTTDSNDVLKLNYSLREKYNWSFSKNRLKSSADSTKPVSYYANNIMENSNNITIMINPYISDKDFMTFDGKFHGKMRVFGDKLVGNLDNYEDKYLRRTYTYTQNNTTNSYLMAPIKLAKNNINSYKTMIAQAGVSPYILRTNFRSNINETPKNGDTYKSFAPVNSIYPFGVYTTESTSRKVIGQVPSKLSRALQLVENDEQYPDIDILVEGGLGTIFMNSNGHEMSGEFTARTLIEAEDTTDSYKDEQSNKQLSFDETVVLTGVEDMRTSRSSLSDDAQDVISSYLAVSNVFLQFANAMQNGGRGDTFFISDVPRGILIKGKDTKITNLYGVEIENNAYDFGESVVHSFPTSVYYPIKHQFDNIVSTYASVYAQWLKIYDDFTGDKVWVPVSGHIAANMASTDAVYGPWYASAGLRRGVINGVLDYAISPTISQRTDLYKICINSVPKIPNYGVTIWGIRTMGKKDSAFDQNTCRRTFLYMEKKVKQLLRYYLFEPNNSYTRLQIFNDIDPFLEGIKNRGGIYSYTLVTDTTVNTPEIINNGDLVVAIAAAPTRTAENIIVEFTANKYTEEVSAAESMN